MALLDRSTSRIRETLQQSGATLIADARTLCTDLRDRVMAELWRRIAPFLDSRSVNTAIRVGDVRCLRTAIKVCNSLEGHRARLKGEPVTACASIVEKVDALTAAASAIEAELGIAAA